MSNDNGEAQFRADLERLRPDYEAKMLCSFCGKTKSEVLCLVAGPTVYICDECVEVAQQVVSEHKKALPTVEILPQPPTRGEAA